MFFLNFFVGKKKGEEKGRKKDSRPEVHCRQHIPAFLRIKAPAGFYCLFISLLCGGVCSLARQATEYGTRTECSSKQVTGVLSRVYYVQYIPTYSGVDVRIEQAPQ